MDIYTVSDNRHDLPRNIQRLLRVRRDLCRSTDFTSTFLSLHATPETDLFIQDELPDDLHPAVVARQITIELIRDLVKLPQPGPRDRREVVVLVVQTHVVGQDVQNTVVRERLWWRRQLGLLALLVRLLQGARVLCENVVLGDEVACYGVQGAGELWRLSSTIPIPYRREDCRCKKRDGVIGSLFPLLDIKPLWRTSS